LPDFGRGLQTVVASNTRADARHSEADGAGDFRPDFSTLSRRGRGPAHSRKSLLSSIASNQLPGKGRKLHLGLDPATGEIIILPPKNANPSPQSAHDPSQRDHHIAAIKTHGRLAWQPGCGETHPLMDCVAIH
jgi:hypothetical protein